MLCALSSPEHICSLGFRDPTELDKQEEKKNIFFLYFFPPEQSNEERITYIWSYIYTHTHIYIVYMKVECFYLCGRMGLWDWINLPIEEQVLPSEIS